MSDIRLVRHITANIIEPIQEYGEISKENRRFFLDGCVWYRKENGEIDYTDRESIGYADMSFYKQFHGVWKMNIENRKEAAI